VGSHSWQSDDRSWMATPRSAARWVTATVRRRSLGKSGDVASCCRRNEFKMDSGVTKERVNNPPVSFLVDSSGGDERTRAPSSMKRAMGRGDDDGPDSPRQRVNDQPFAIHRHAEYSNSRRLEQLPRWAIVRIFDGNRGTRRQQGRHAACGAQRPISVAKASLWPIWVATVLWGECVSPSWGVNGGTMASDLARRPAASVCRPPEAGRPPPTILQRPRYTIPRPTRTPSLSQEPRFRALDGGRSLHK
jgi:hypothetical protein